MNDEGAVPTLADKLYHIAISFKKILYESAVKGINFNKTAKHSTKEIP